MKIQDIRSGISHLGKKANAEGRASKVGVQFIPKRDLGSRRELSSALDEPCWSVVSFDKCEAGGLDYRQAAELVAILDEHGIHGLCIITDEAAQRYGS